MNTAMAASWSTTCGSRIRDRNGGSSIADSVSCWLVMTKNGGSSIVLASDGGGGGPRSRWQLMMDPCGGTGQ